MYAETLAGRGQSTHSGVCMTRSRREPSAVAASFGRQMHTHIRNAHCCDAVQQISGRCRVQRCNRVQPHLGGDVLAQQQLGRGVGESPADVVRVPSAQQLRNAHVGDLGGVQAGRQQHVLALYVAVDHLRAFIDLSKRKNTRSARYVFVVLMMRNSRHRQSSSA